jgi:HPt (histidine-containing phosphotransfer) domain-containing protein
MDMHIAKPLREETLVQALSWFGLVDSEPAVTVAERDGDLLDPAIIGPFRELARSGKPDLFHNLLAVYAKDTPQELKALRAAAAAGDGDAVARVAHKLKGGVAGLGATEMAATCALIEDCAQAGDLGALDELLAELDRQAAAVEAALTRMAEAA